MSRKPKHIILKPIEDYPGVFLYEEVESLAGANFADTPECSLARADLHGSRMSALIKAEAESQQQQIIEMIQPFLRQVLRVLKSLSPQDLRGLALFLTRLVSWEKQIQLLDTWLRYQVATGNIPQSLYIALQQIDKSKLADLQPAVTRFYIESLPLTFWGKAVDWLKTEADRALITLLDVALVDSAPLEDATKLHAFDSDMRIKELIGSDPDAESRLRSILCPENKAIIEDRKATHGWDGDANKAFQLLDDTLRVDLQLQLKIKGWHVPGARYGGIDEWELPLNDELHLLRIGEFHGLEWARKQSLLELLAKGASGELRNTLTKIANNKLLGEIRKQNRRLGIEVPLDWSYEGKTEEQIRKQVDKDINALATHEVLDYEIQREDSVTSKLEQATDERSFKDWGWYEDEGEVNRRLYAKERIAQLAQVAKLTPRLQLVAKLYDKSNEVIALALSRAFGKSVKPGAVRALKHDLLQKLREAASEK